MNAAHPMRESEGTPELLSANNFQELLNADCPSPSEFEVFQLAFWRFALAAGEISSAGGISWVLPALPICWLRHSLSANC